MNVYDYLTKLKIEYQKLEHQPVATAKEAMFIENVMDGIGVKNLFLKNNDQEYFLYLLKGNKRANLKSLAIKLNSGKLHFASEEELKEYLNLFPGSVSLLGIINDTGKVKVIIDEELVGMRLLFHPNDNSTTISLKYDDVLKIINNCGNDLIIY